ncbi:MAG: heme ABC transporter ATP-binding protein [Ketobacteraceae bacterium]|nr:heme ABC transporter ATP-binding protein [Ketobacteraceae bacterium]
MSLVARDLGYAVAENWLVRHVNLKVNDGEMLVILGPNGAGKSTLFKMLSGEWPATEGAVSLFDSDYSQWAGEALARRRAILPQHSSLTFPFTVEEVVRMGRTPHETGVKKDREIVAELIDRCDLESLKKRLYPWLSGGEKQRVQLARVLAQIWPTKADNGVHKCLFLDEPTSALDIAHQHSMLKLARELTGQGYSVVVILHDLNLASAYADRVLMLHEGRVAGYGSVREVFNPALLQQVFDVEVQVLDHPERQTPWVIW